MPEKRVTVRVPEELFKKLEAEAKKQGKSNNQTMLDLWEKGFRHDTEGEDQVPAMRLILLKYPARCLKCGCDLQ